MKRDKPDDELTAGLRLKPDHLRWRCDPDSFPFETTRDLEGEKIRIIGQPRAERALEIGLALRSKGYNVFVSGEVGCGRSTVVKRKLAGLAPGGPSPGDLAYVHNFSEPDEPHLLSLPLGKARVLRQAMEELVLSLAQDLPQLFDSEPYRKRRSSTVEEAAGAQKALLKEFEKRVEGEGFALVQVQAGPMVRPRLVPVVAGNAVDMDQLEALVEQEQFKRDEFDNLKGKQAALIGELEGLSKQVRKLQRSLRTQLEELNREVARPLVEEAVAEIRETFDAEGLPDYLDAVAEDILDHLDGFAEEGDAEDSGGGGTILGQARYRVNLLVDNAKTEGPPVIWETSPSYRNLFGAIDKTRTEAGDWETDHTRVKSGSLLQANGGYLVLDAMDVLVEPGVWAALKRTLRHHKVEIQSFDPMFPFTGLSMKPESVPIDVKVVMIGTRHIYRLLYSLDEDFKKIFKVKAEFAMETERNDDEQANYARLIHKRCQAEDLPPFHKEAVAAVVEQGVRMTENHAKLTTRFREIVDVIREAGYWAGKDEATMVHSAHVDLAIDQRIYRLNMIEDLLRQRIADGTVLIDLDGERVGQVNGLAVLDLGDHMFALPSRITATTAMGRAGIIDIDRESEMSGSIHTKGVLIMSGFLRSRFAQDKPLTLTASICFEQNYGGVEGDSASSTELYALLSSLSGVPLRQGIAVTGSVNQHGEIQPIGGVNEKIEGFYDLCRIRGLTGDQGVLMPARNLHQMMLRKDLVEDVRDGKFHVWAVSTVEEGMHVLSGRRVGERGEGGRWTDGSIFARVDARLVDLAEGVTRYGTADSRGAV